MASVQSHKYDILENFVSECRKYVNAIQNYTGDDPLAPWYDYLLWIEENFVIDFEKETLFENVLEVCLSRFEKSDQYKQDRRLIKLFIKFVHFQEQQDMFYGAMLKNGCGSKVADLYINWAFHYDWNGNFLKAEKIFQRGLCARAEPFDLLKSAHEEFGYSMSQRLLYGSNEHFQHENRARMQKRLETITALRITGTSSNATRSTALQKFGKNILMDHCIPYHKTGDVTPENPHNTSVAKTIIDSARKMRRENSFRQSATPCRLDFNRNALEPVKNVPEVNMYEKGIQLGKHFKAKNQPQRLPPARAYLDPEIGTYRKEIAAYDKNMLVPASNLAFSLEELRAYNWFKKRGIVNAFTTEQDKIWGVGYDVPIRWPIVFGRSNFPQPEWKVSRIMESDECNENGPHKFRTNMPEIYPKNSTQEYQIEEIIWRKRNVKKSVSLTHQMSSTLKIGRRLNRTNSNDSKLSPIVEMEDVPRKHESIHPNGNVEPNKKRKSSIFPGFDALNDTCTTQMFGNLLSSTAISTPKAKMSRYDELTRSWLDETKGNFYSDNPTVEVPSDKSKTSNWSNEPPNQPNDHGFAIYEDKTQTIHAIKEFVSKNTAGNATIDNKENIPENLKFELTKLNEPNRSDSKQMNPSVINLNAKKNENLKKDSDTPSIQPVDTQRSNGFGFDIFTDKTENMVKIVENARKITIHDSTLGNKENLFDKENESMQPKTSLENLASINEMINSILNVTKSDGNKVVNLELSGKMSKTLNQMADQNPTKPMDLEQLEAEERQLLKKCQSIREDLERVECETNEKSMFKPPMTPNVSNRTVDLLKKSCQSFVYEMDTTEEFERIEAECADSPTLELPESKLRNSADAKFKFNATKKDVSGSALQLSIEVMDIERKHILENSKLCDRTKLNWTLQQSMGQSMEQPFESPLPKCPEEPEEEEDDIGKSIYVKQPEPEFNEKDADWHEVTQFLAAATATNEYKVEQVNLNETRNRIDTHMLNLKDLNPFDPDMQKDILLDLGFLDQINGANNFNCVTMNIVKPLKPKATLDINNQIYKICKVIGTGAFGKVFSAECKKTGVMLALKQQRPPNLWEYYICIEVQSRIRDESVRKGFMSVDFALIGNNATIYASKFSKHGTILNVCNKVKQATNKAIEECIVMILVKQMLTIIEHLHKAQFIHADVKPDNFLLMDKLSLNYNNPDIVLQLIDFGQTIDMNYFKNHVFWAKVKTENFICTEMMENKPWTYHCDLFCLASTIYTMVAGKYMIVKRDNITGKYQPQKLPRYVNGGLWEQIFDTLINVPSIKRMPELSDLHKLLDAELSAIGSKKVTDAINRFNKALD